MLQQLTQEHYNKNPNTLSSRPRSEKVDFGPDDTQTRLRSLWAQMDAMQKTMGLVMDKIS